MKRVRESKDNRIERDGLRKMKCDEKGKVNKQVQGGTKVMK